MDKLESVLEIETDKNYLGFKDTCRFPTTGQKTRWEQHWTSPGGNPPQGTNYTASCLPSRKLYYVDELDTLDTAGESSTNSSVMYSSGPLHMAKQKQANQLEHTFSSYMRIRDVALKTCQKRWMIGRSGERGSGISVLAVRHHDDDDTKKGTRWIVIFSVLAEHRMKIKESEKRDKHLDLAREL